MILRVAISTVRLMIVVGPILRLTLALPILEL